MGFDSQRDELLSLEAKPQREIAFTSPTRNGNVFAIVNKLMWKPIPSLLFHKDYKKPINAYLMGLESSRDKFIALEAKL